MAFSRRQKRSALKTTRTLHSDEETLNGESGEEVHTRAHATANAPRGPMSFDRSELGAHGPLSASSTDRNRKHRPLKLGSDKVPAREDAYKGEQSSLYSTESLRALHAQQQGLPGDLQPTQRATHSQKQDLQEKITSEPSDEAAYTYDGATEVLGSEYDRYSFVTLSDDDVADQQALHGNDPASARKSRMSKRVPKPASDIEGPFGLAEDNIEEDEGRLAFDASRLQAGLQPTHVADVNSIPVDSDDDAEDRIGSATAKQQRASNSGEAPPMEQKCTAAGADYTAALQQRDSGRALSEEASTDAPDAIIGHALSQAETLEQYAQEEDNIASRAAQSEQDADSRVEQFQSELQQRRNILESVRSIQEYMSSLCDCLAEKAPQLEALEEKVASVEKAYAHAQRSANRREAGTDVESAREKLQEEIDRASTRVRQVFEDVSEQYASASAVRSMLSFWKRHGGGSYDECHVSECVPMLYAPFVRAELAHSYLPLCCKGKALEEMESVNELRLHDAEMNERSLQRVLEAVVVPRLRAAVEEIFDPEVQEQRQRVQQNVEELVHIIGEKNRSEQLQKLLQIMYAKQQQRLHGDVDHQGDTETTVER